MTRIPAPSSWPFPKYVIRRGVLVIVRQRKVKVDPLAGAKPAPF